MLNALCNDVGYVCCVDNAIGHLTGHFLPILTFVFHTKTPHPVFSPHSASTHPLSIAIAGASSQHTTTEPAANMRRSVLSVLPQLLRSNAAASAPASYQLSARLQSIRGYADDANLKVDFGVGW